MRQEVRETKMSDKDKPALVPTQPADEAANQDPQNEESEKKPEGSELVDTITLARFSHLKSLRSAGYDVDEDEVAKVEAEIRDKEEAHEIKPEDAPQ